MKHYQIGEDVVEAAILTEANFLEVSNWARGYVVQEQDAIDPSKTYLAINIATPDGNKRVSLGEVVTKFEGHFFKVGRNEFEALYREVE